MTLLAAQSPGTTAPARGAPLSDLITLTIVFAVAGLLLLAVSVTHRRGRFPWLQRLGDFAESTSGLPPWAALPQSIGAVSLGHIDLFHKAYEPLLFKTDKTSAPYCYRCPHNKAKPERADARDCRKKMMNASGWKKMFQAPADCCQMMRSRFTEPVSNTTPRTDMPMGIS